MRAIPVSGWNRAVLLAAAVLFTGCSGIEKAPPRPQAARVDRSFQLDVPRIMAGTVASETVVLGYQPVVVRGYGLVVGLKGTGCRDMPPQLRAHMLAEMARHGIGQASRGLGHLRPEQMLDSFETAVVVVEAIIPPGAVGRQVYRNNKIDGTRFDVRVYADPRTGTTSLEGGRLYTTELRPVRPGEIFPPTGSRQAAPLAEAHGPVFVNPFAEPKAVQSAIVNRNVGRIMNGGEVIQDIPIKLRLATPSHARAELIQNAVNARFRQEPGQLDPTAWGESDDSIRITVPPSFRNDTDEFVELLRHSSLRQAGVEAIAVSIQRLTVNEPSSSYDAAWRWQALGVKALPTVRELYDYPEELPRIAALRAGSKLGDPLVITHLLDMSHSASPDIRRQAVGLLGDMPLDPRIDRGLRTLLSDDDVDVRLGAYEALVKRVDPFITRHAVDEKFVLDIIDSDKPLIYITQIGQPRIAVFGRDLSLERPLLVDAWSGRFIVQGEAGSDLVEVFYRAEDGASRIIERADPRLEEFIQFLGHTKTIEHPKIGLGLSYGETIAALHQIWREKYINADFKAQQDRVLAAIARQMRQRRVDERPEFSDPDFDILRPPADGPPTNEDGTADLERVAPPPMRRPAEQR